MSRRRAQESVRPHGRPAHGLAVGAASPACGWSVCLTCSPGSEEAGGCLWHRQGEWRGPLTLEGKRGWVEDSWPQTLTNSAFAVGLHPRCHHTALKGVSSLCPNCPLVLRAGLQGGGPEAWRHLWEGMPARKPRSEHLGGFLVFSTPRGLGSWFPDQRPLQWKQGVLTTGHQGSPNIWQFLRELGLSREGGNKGQPLGSCWSPGTCRIQASPASPSLCLLLRRAL